MILKYLIIDDEPLAHKIIEDYAKDVPFLELQGNCYDGLQAISFLNTQTVDLIFLDIQMPKIKGLDFLRMLAKPPSVIITSAYKEYALEGYELSVSDYLLKPFGFDRFIKAVNKVMEKQQKQDIPIFQKTVPNQNSPNSIFVKGDKKYHQIFLKDILYLEAYGSYVKIYLEEKMVLANENLAYFEKTLPEQFFRTHKSYMVAKERIETIEGNRIFIKENEIPIGNMYKLNVMKLLGK